MIMKNQEIFKNAFYMAWLFTENTKIPSVFIGDYAGANRKVAFVEALKILPNYLFSKYQYYVKRITDNNDTSKLQKPNYFLSQIDRFKVRIEQILKDLPKEIAERIVTLSPNIENRQSVTKNSDFIAIIDYLEEKRNRRNANDQEIGDLAMISYEIEKRIKNDISKLKNPLAEKLRNKGHFEIDGISVELWQYHTYQSINANKVWNSIKSYTELNSKTEGETGSIVMSGTFQIPRQEAAEYAVKLGFAVRSNVSKNTNYLVVGSENVGPNKIAKIIELRERGHDVKVIDENTFLGIVSENLDI